MKRTRYAYDDAASICQQVIIAWPGGKGPVTIYVPPIGEELPYTVTFDEYEQAADYAVAAHHKVSGGLTKISYLKETHDHTPWWLVNLRPAA